MATEQLNVNSPTVGQQVAVWPYKKFATVLEVTNSPHTFEATLVKVIDATGKIESFYSFDLGWLS